MSKAADCGKEETMSLMELKDAVKEYTAGDITVHALNHVNLAVEQGEIIMIPVLSSSAAADNL
ncbi:MAG: hypothetical protein NC124_17420 [Clostridium sp.]|nr:hypothetical protein [Clostridium sp.]